MASIVDCGVPLKDLITVVVTTSPTCSDPDLDLIRATFASFSCANFESCPKILVADCFDEGEMIKGAYHKGTLPIDHIDRYNMRLQNFSEAHWAKDVQLLKLESWHGFAKSTERALELVKTPLVCIVQHDLSFNRPINIQPIAELLLNGKEREEMGLSPNIREEKINFIALPKASTIKYRTKLRSKTGLEVGEPVLFENVSNSDANASLIRLPQFLDGTHIARVDWYKDIFQIPLLHGEKLAKGQFTEDNLGQYMLQQAKENNGKCFTSTCVSVPSSNPSDTSETNQISTTTEGVSVGVLRVMGMYGGWLWHDSECEDPVIFHLDGRVFQSASEREKRGIPNKDARYTIAEAATTFMETHQ